MLTLIEDVEGWVMAAWMKRKICKYEGEHVKISRGPRGLCPLGRLWQVRKS